MKKKHDLPIKVLFFAFILLISLCILSVSVSAYQSYVGVKIESVYNPIYGDTEEEHTQWCLPGEGTILAIKYNGITINNGEVMTIKTTGSHGGCDQDTIWSNLVDLSSEYSYTVLLATAREGYTKSGYAWFGYGPADDSCDTYCASLNYTCVEPGIHDADLTCADMKIMTGESHSCESRYNSARNPAYNWDHGKWEISSSPGHYTCSARLNTIKRFCTCDATAFFTFNFVAP